MREVLLTRRKSPHLQILLVLVLFQQTVIANPNGLRYSAVGDRWFESLTINQGFRPSDLREIKPGVTIERRLYAGEKHLYAITLKAGEYMKIVALYPKINFKMEVLDPEGIQAAECGVGGMGPTDSLWMLAAETGTYQIRISGFPQYGPFLTYAINVEKVAELRNATSLDQAYVKADHLFWEGNKLLDKGGDPAFHEAAQKYLESLQLWRVLGDQLGEASTLHALGYVHGQLHESEKAIEFYEQALPLWRSLKKHESNEATTLYNLGGIYSSLGKALKAIKCYQEAIAVRRSFEYKDGLDFALNNLGQVYSDIGEFQLALKAHQEALQLRIDQGSREREARSLSNISGVYFRLGDFQEALNYCLRALPLRRAAGDRRGEAITLTNIGSNYRELGEPEKALSYYHQALPLMRETHDRHGEGAVLGGIGRSYFDLGDYAKALEIHNQSLLLMEQEKDLYGQATSLTEIGNTYSRMADQKSALAYFGQSLQLRRAIGDRRGEAITLQRSGETYAALGDNSKARQHFDEALDLSRNIKNRFLEANLLYDIAHLDQSMGHILEARSQIEDAIAIIESTRARVAGDDLRASFFASKQDFYELEIDLLMQSHRLDRDQGSMVQAFSISEQRRARSLLDSLEEAHSNLGQRGPAQLFERERSLRVKLDYKAETQIKLLSGKHTQEQASVLAQEIENISREYEQVLGEISAADPHYAAFTRSTPLAVKQIQREILDPDALLLEYSLGKERSYLWAVTPTDVTAYELPSRVEIETEARNAYSFLTARSRILKFEKPEKREARIKEADSSYLVAASRLSQMLLGPVASTIEGKRLLIVADGALQYVPFAALPSPRVVRLEANVGSIRDAYQPLMIDHEITNLPSASVLGVLRREVANRKPARKTVAVLADAVFSKDDERVRGLRSKSKTGNDSFNSHQMVRGRNGSDPKFDTYSKELGDPELTLNRVPFTRQEAQEILRIIPRNERFAAFDFSANRATAISPELSQYRIVHFATHGLLNMDHPGLSGLIFSLVDRRGNDQKGFVSGQEVFELRLPADLVVLSGCRTGLGKEIRGEGVVGLTRGFIYAGAARVAVSLWDVNDLSTADLMGQFYRGMLGRERLRPSAALREAQIAMWKSTRWHAPYYWGAFVLQGEYR